jgi:S1-C subfamily serine protease
MPARPAKQRRDTIMLRCRKHVVIPGALVCALVAGSLAPAQELRYPVGMLGRYTSDGMLIQKVLPATPAEKAGLQSGDFILKVDGRLVNNQEDFVNLINSSGGQVLLVVKKGTTGRIGRIGLDLTGTSRFGPPPPYFLGVVGTFTPSGVVVGTAIPCTPAARIGLAKGDLIARINNLPVTNANDFFTILYGSGGTVTLQVRKANGRLVRQEVDLTTYELGAVGTFGRDGLTIGLVAPNTPAAYVGLQKGDMILRIDNQPIRNQKEAERLIKNSGGAVTMLVQRPGQLATQIDVELMNNALGAWCEAAGDGMRIITIVPNSPAEAIGLLRGDTLLKIDDQRVRTHHELVRALRSARGLTTIVYRQGLTGRLVSIDVDLAR